MFGAVKEHAQKAGDRSGFIAGDKLFAPDVLG
jgi:hypothetical protein